MAESVVSFLLQKLNSLLVEEVRRLGGIRNDIVEVRDELHSMKAFLRDADALEDEDELLKVWVKQVRELAFDTEDLIDEFLLRFEHPSQPGLCGRLSKIGRVINTLKARRRVASELRQIKSNAISIFERHKRYSHGPRAGDHRGSVSRTKTDAQSLFQRQKDVRLVPETRLVGIQEPKKELITQLLEDAEESGSVKVLAVDGMGGLGKTTLVNQVYRDDGVRRQFQRRAWITVSQSFEEHKVLKDMIKQMFEGISQTAPQELDAKEKYSLKEDIMSFLSDKKYLIVLDDVWDLTSWESLKYTFPDNKFGSRVMVTTRNRDVANSVTRDPFKGFVHHLQPLSSEESWELFCARVFQGGLCPPHLEEASRHILERCRGMPLAIVSISGVLASKDTSIEEWERVRCNFMAGLLGNNQLSDMEKILSLSFNDLPYYLKSCLMCLTMFPEDFKQHKYYTIKLWIAEGFIQQMGDLTQEEVGELYFNELLNRSLIQVVEEGDQEIDYNWFCVHDVVLGILLRKAKNQNFAAITGEKNLRVPERVRRLSVCTTLEKLEGHQNLSRLGTLIFPHLRGSIYSSESMSEFLTNCRVRLLKVLDCSHLAIDTFPKFITTQYNLRFLRLDNIKLTSIPPSIGRLRKLETLQLEDTLVKELPAEILQIHGLRHLLASREVTEGSPPETTIIGVRVPTGMGTLTSLQTLVTIQVNDGGGLELITSLGKLKQLRKLHIQQLRAEHGPILCSSIEKLSQLRILKMESREEDDEILDVQYISSPPPYLKDLFMSGRLVEIPSWVGMLHRLAILKLKWSELKVDPLESLQALPNLLQLYLYNSTYDGEELFLRAGGFQMLKKLYVENLCRLRSVTVEEGAMPRLEILEFSKCKLMEKVPLGIEFLTNLNKLQFIHVGDQFVKRLRSNNEESNFQRLKRKVSVSVGALNAEGIWESYL